MTRPPTPRPDDSRGGLLGPLAMVGAAILAILCCAGPLLLASGALTGLAGVLVSPWLLAPAVVLLAGGLTWWLRHRGPGSGDACRTPPAARADRHDRPLPRKH
ncbi:mercury transporter [Streptomyces sp. NPDC048385]|uniref:mercury transporter n=1 Tax=unclassified Streptomyces TaxID=2593676 RepID=UPI003433E193